MLTYMSSAPFLVIQDAELTAGNFSMAFDGSTLSNEGYYCQVAAGTSVSKRFVLVNNPDPDRLVPLVLTDSTGRFSIPRSVLPIGQVFTYTFETGQTAGNVVVSDSLTVVIAPAGASPILWKVNATDHVVIDSTLRMKQ